MSVDELVPHVHALVRRASETDKSADEALKFSQAAFNAANAIRVLVDPSLINRPPAKE